MDVTAWTEYWAQQEDLDPGELLLAPDGGYLADYDPDEDPDHHDPQGD